MSVRRCNRRDTIMGDRPETRRRTDWKKERRTRMHSHCSSYSSSRGWYNHVKTPRKDCGCSQSHNVSFVDWIGSSWSPPNRRQEVVVSSIRDCSVIQYLWRHNNYDVMGFKMVSPTQKPQELSKNSPFSQRKLVIILRFWEVVPNLIEFFREGDGAELKLPPWCFEPMLSLKVCHGSFRVPIGPELFTVDIETVPLGRTSIFALPCPHLLSIKRVLLLLPHEISRPLFR